MQPLPLLCFTLLLHNTVIRYCPALLFDEDGEKHITTIC